MAEGRMIKREIKKSKKLANIKNDKARVLYFMLYPHADVEGRLSADPVDIMAECIPLFNWKEEVICKALSDLHNIGLIVQYKVNECIYLQITRFHDFQTINRDREAKSKIPPPSSGELQSNQENSPISKGKLSKDKLTNTYIERWNSALTPKVSKLTETRLTHLNSRLNEKEFVDNYEILLQKILESDFLTGKNPSATHPNFKADFDWIIKNDTNYVKVLEGKYDNKPKRGR